MEGGDPIRRVKDRLKMALAWLGSPVALILALTLVKGWLFATVIPYGEAPDEQPHFNYVMHLKNQRRLPVYYFHYWNTRLYRRAVHPMDYPDPEANRLGGAATYCAVHGPLYYVTCAIPVAVFAKKPATAAYLCRLVSVVLATLTILVYCIICRILFPRDPPLAIAIPLLASFLPQFTFIGAVVNNDCMVNLIAALMSLVWVRSVMDGIGYSRSVRMGMLTGLWFLTKGSFPIAVATTLCLYSLDFYRIRPPVGKTLGMLGSYFGVAVLVGLPLGIRNWVLFESPSGLSDPFAFWGAGTHLYPDLWTMLVGNPIGSQVTWSAVTFKSFWGNFDWMILPLPRWVYSVCWCASLLSIPGTLVYVISHRKEEETRGLILLLLFGILNIGSLAVFCYYLIWQAQGRHLFASLLPIMMTLGIGLSALGISDRYRRFILFALVAAMAWLNLYSLFGTILPHYY